MTTLRRLDAWTEQFFRVADAMSEMATCPRASMGAVIVSKSRRILATGFNGSPSGASHCDPSGCIMVDGHCRRAVHAEANAIIQVARYGGYLDGLEPTIYITSSPCPICAGLIAQAGIREVVYRDVYSELEISTKVLAQAGVSLWRWAPIGQ